MRNHIYLDNNLQVLLVHQAIKREISRYEKMGFSEDSPEISNLNKILPKMQLHRGVLKEPEQV
jgi:hypothetical protein